MNVYVYVFTQPRAVDSSHLATPFSSQTAYRTLDSGSGPELGNTLILSTHIPLAARLQSDSDCCMSEQEEGRDGDTNTQTHEKKKIGYSKWDRGSGREKKMEGKQRGAELGVMEMSRN